MVKSKRKKERSKIHRKGAKNAKVKKGKNIGEKEKRHSPHSSSKPADRETLPGQKAPRTRKNAKEN